MKTLRISPRMIPTPDIIILALPLKSKIRHIVCASQVTIFSNFRRAIKSLVSMKWNIPFTTDHKKYCDRRREKCAKTLPLVPGIFVLHSIQSNGVPWRITSLDEATCFIGVSFFIARGSVRYCDNEIKRSSSF